MFEPADQSYLFQARQMQALSLAVHIPLVCFGIAFPAMILLGGSGSESRSGHDGVPVTSMEVLL